MNGWTILSPFMMELCQSWSMDFITPFNNPSLLKMKIHSSCSYFPHLHIENKQPYWIFSSWRLIVSSGFFRKDQNLLSPVNCWYLLLNQVRRESKDHATLSDIYLNNVIMRFMQISEDSTRLLKKVRMDRLLGYSWLADQKRSANQLMTWPIFLLWMPTCHLSISVQNWFV